MKKNIGMFLVIFILTGFGTLLMSEELLKLEIVKEPTFKEVGGYWYVYMDVTCQRNKIAEMFQVSNQEFEKQGIKSDWVTMIFYNWPPTDEDTVNWKRGLVVPENTKCAPPLIMVKIEKFKALAYTITGSYTLDDVSNGNKLMDDYIAKMGYKHIWPIYETYRIGEPRQLHFWYLVEE